MTHGSGELRLRCGALLAELLLEATLSLSLRSLSLTVTVYIYIYTFACFCFSVAVYNDLYVLTFSYMFICFLINARAKRAGSMEDVEG